MLPKGTIANVLDEFFARPDRDAQIQRALDEFFGGNRPARMSEKQLAFVNEWLVFDFRLAGGLTVLEDYRQRHDADFSDEKKKIYLDLCATHHYGAFEVVKVYRDEGLDICDVRTGQKFFVQEKLLTHSAQRGNIFLNRVARFGDHWELVGADPAVLPIAKSAKRWKEAAFGGDDAITPRLAFSMLADGIEY